MKNYTKFSGCLIFVFLMSLISFSQTKGYVSISIDPLMMTQGPYAESSKGELDFIIRGGVTKGAHSEFGAYYECFQIIDYYGYGGFYNYKLSIDANDHSYNKWEFLVGPELGLIQRYVENTCKENSCILLNTAVNGEIRYFINKNVGFLIASNLRYRPDLNYYYDSKDLIKYNGYMGVIFKW